MELEGDCFSENELTAASSNGRLTRGKQKSVLGPCGIVECSYSFTLAGLSLICDGFAAFLDYVEWQEDCVRLNVRDGTWEALGVASAAIKGNLMWPSHFLAAERVVLDLGRYLGIVTEDLHLVCALSS